MAEYPTPGVGISRAGIDFGSGFNANPTEGINYTAGLSLAGLDRANNPFISVRAVGSITATAATVTWTCAPASPLGSVARVAYGTGAAPTTVAETGTPPLTAHSVALSGLVTATTYQYTITQPGAAGTGGQSTSSGTFRTT